MTIAIIVNDVTKSLMLEESTTLNTGPIKKPIEISNKDSGILVFSAKILDIYPIMMINPVNNISCATIYSHPKCA